MKHDHDTTEQNFMFAQYVIENSSGRQQHHTGTYGYDEAEWEAFQSGWNAAKQHFGVEE